MRKAWRASLVIWLVVACLLPVTAAEKTASDGGNSTAATAKATGAAAKTNKPKNNGLGSLTGGSTGASAARSTEDSGDYYGDPGDDYFGSTPYTPPDRLSGFLDTGNRRRETGFQRTQDGHFNISGSADMAFNYSKVSGSGSTFDDDQYTAQHSLTENASLLLAGPIWKWANLHASAQIDQRSFGFSDTRPVWKVFWEDQNNRVTLGTISPTMGESASFVSFSRQLRGLMAEGRIANRVDYMGFASQVQGTIRSETFKGDGTSGPFYLTYTPIVDGSAIVMVDGVVQQAGSGTTGDYTLNSTTGELNFNGATIISTAQTIRVRYETESTSGPKDWLVGARFSGSVSRKLRLGVSYLGQISSADSGGASETRVTDSIIVPTASAGPFTLIRKPVVESSETVTVDGVLKTRVTDYEINYTTGQIQFYTTLAEGQTIVVRYTVIEAVDTTSANRSMYGIDGSWTVGNSMLLSWEAAVSKGTAESTNDPFDLDSTSSGGYSSYMSSGSLDTTNYLSSSTLRGAAGRRLAKQAQNRVKHGALPAYFGSRWASRLAGSASDLTREKRADTTTATSGNGGTAFKVTMAGRLAGVELQADVKSISDHFSRIESTSSFQVERGFNLRASYSPSRAMTLGGQMSYQLRPYWTTSTDEDNNTVSTKSTIHSLLRNLSYSWRFGPQSQTQLTYSAQKNSGGGSSVDYSRFDVSANHGWSRQINSTFNLDYSTSGTTGTASDTNDNTRSLTGRFGSSYSSSGGRVSLSCDASYSRSKSSNSRNIATNIVSSVNWQALKQLSLQFSHQLSHSSSRTTTSSSSSRIPNFRTLMLDDLYERSRRWRDDTSSDDTSSDSSTDGSSSSTDSSKTSSNTQTTMFTVTAQPLRDASATFSWSHTVSDTGLLASSVTDGIQTNFHYQIGENLGLGFGWNGQTLRYTDSGDKTDTSTLNGTVDWRVSRHLDMSGDFQAMNTSTVYSSTSSNSTSDSGDTHYLSTSFDAHWTIPGGRHSTSYNMAWDKSTGSSSGYTRLSLGSSWDMRINRILSLKFGYTFTDYAANGSTTSNSSSYTSHVFTSSLSARF